MGLKGYVQTRVSAAAAEKLARMHCKHGHPLSGENLYVYDGKRMCKQCRKDAGASYRGRAPK